MKELSIEEKAKRYDEAIEKFDVILHLNTVKESGTIFADDVRKILPELKESDDERIRKGIFKTLSKKDARDILISQGIKLSDALAWLEKQGDIDRRIQEEIEKQTKQQWKTERQGEQKPTDKVEQNMELTDFESALFTAFSDAWQQYLDGEEVNVAQWAKEHSTELLEVANQNHVTREKEPKKVHVIDEGKSEMDYCFTKMMNGEKINPAWSEEDGRKIETLSAIIFDYAFHKDAIDENKDLTGEYAELYNWLQSFPERIQPHPKYEWKQENTDALTDFENLMMHIGISFFGQHAGLDPNDTNTIKEQANILLGLVPKQEWSEKDEEMFKLALKYLKQSYYSEESVVEWFKSLKEHMKGE